MQEMFLLFFIGYLYIGGERTKMILGNKMMLLLFCVFGVMAFFF